MNVIAVTLLVSLCLAGIFIVAFAIAYNLAAVTVCLLGLMNPLLAAILMPLSSLACLALAAGPLPPHRSPAASAIDPAAGWSDAFTPSGSRFTLSSTVGNG